MSLKNQVFEIWVEGYRGPGVVDNSPATMLGKAEGVDFLDACISFFGNNRSFVPEENTYNYCRLFDNEVEASRRFK